MWDGGPTPPRPLSESGRCGVGVLCIIGASHGLVFFWMFEGLSISLLRGLLSWSGRDFGRFRLTGKFWIVWIWANCVWLWVRGPWVSGVWLLSRDS